jgi:hypothetical protein
LRIYRLVCDMIATYKRSSTNAEGAGGTAKVAVSSTDDRVGVEKGTATQMTQAGKLNANNERQIALGGGYATNNVRGVLIPVFWELLRDCGTVDERRDCKGGKDGFGVHFSDSGIWKREAGWSLSCR